MKSPIRILFIIAVASSLVLLLILYLCIWKPTTFVPGYTVTQELGTGEGFVLSLLYYEQIGNGASNVMNLQCWAGSLKMNVVEPFIREVRDSGDQVFYFDLVENFASAAQQPPRFRQLFDFDHWNAYSKSRGYATLVSVEEFLAKASKKLIYVTLVYSGSSKCPKKTGISQRTLLLFEYHHFVSVRKVCIDLLHEGRLRTQQEFNELVFGDLRGHSNFTVVFDEWRGIRNETEREGKLDFVDVNSEWHRILIRNSLCWYDCLALQPYYATWVKLDSGKSLERKAQVLDTAVLKISKLGLIPSEQTLTDVDTFRDKHFGGKDYLALKVRMEKYEITEHNLHTACIEKIASLKKYALDEYKLTRTFFTSDLGKYGSNSWSWPQGNPKLSEQLYEDMVSVLGTSSDGVDAVSQDFEELTHSTGRVRIAWTQGMVVAEARCIIFIGGGAFHGLILNMHSALYRGNECFVYLDEHCNEQAKLGFI